MLQTSITELKQRYGAGIRLKVPQSFFKQSFRSSCSDLPYLFNSKSLNMHEQDDNCTAIAKRPFTAKEIIKEIILFDDPENIREDLHEMMISFLMNDNNSSNECKDRIYGSYITLYEALKKMEQLNPRKVVCNAIA